jgi:hypothetical protein
MKVSELFSGYLEAEDLPDDRDVTVTIESVRAPGKDDKGKDGRVMDKPIVKLTKVKKEWVLNKTNARTIRRMHGNETEAWHGKEVTIYRTTCAAFGDANTPCIRVRGNKL